MTEQEISDLPEPPTPEMEDYTYVFSATETKEMICEALRHKADRWEDDAREESLRGAASQAMMAMCRWGANQLREIAGVIAHYPEFETRQREKPLVVTIPGFPNLEPFKLYPLPGPMVTPTGTAPGLTGPMFIGGFTSAPSDEAVEAAIKKGEEIRTGSADDSAPVVPPPEDDQGKDKSTHVKPRGRPPKLPTHE